MKQGFEIHSNIGSMVAQVIHRSGYHPKGYTSDLRRAVRNKLIWVFQGELLKITQTFVADSKERIL